MNLVLHHAVRDWLIHTDPHDVVMVGVSGGCDSMALADVLLHESARLSHPIRVIAIVVDHGLQADSAHIAQRVKLNLGAVGFQEIIVERAHVEMKDGIEASARRARYAAFARVSEIFQPRYFFLGHTLDDQAETVLLGLARGSGTRSLSGMADHNGHFVRPFLDIERAQTRQHCIERGLEIWEDPHNEDARFLRVRVRHEVMPQMESILGPGVAQALARSASLLRDDADALDEWAAREVGGLDPDPNSRLGPQIEVDIERLARMPKAIRTRVVRLLIYSLGAPPGSLSATHIAPIEALITDWHGQGTSSLPGGVKVARISGRLSLLREP